MERKQYIIPDVAVIGCQLSTFITASPNGADGELDDGSGEHFDYKGEGPEGDEGDAKEDLRSFDLPQWED